MLKIHIFQNIIPSKYETLRTSIFVIINQNANLYRYRLGENINNGWIIYILRLVIWCDIFMGRSWSSRMWEPGEENNFGETHESKRNVGLFMYPNVKSQSSSILHERIDATASWVFGIGCRSRLVEFVFVHQLTFVEDYFVFDVGREQKVDVLPSFLQLLGSPLPHLGCWVVLFFHSNT